MKTSSTLCNKGLINDFTDFVRLIATRAILLRFPFFLTARLKIQGQKVYFFSKFL